MLKKSLIALAVAAASTSALAVNVVVDTDEIVYSNQGAVAVDEFVAGNLSGGGTGIEITLRAEYAVGDIITLTFSGGELDTSTAPTTATSTGAAADITVGLLSSTETSLTYRVTEVSTAATTIDGVLTIAGLEFDADSVIAAGSVTVTYAAETSTGVAIDAASGTDSASATVFLGIDQFAASIATGDAFDGVIDVEDERESFETALVSDDLDVTFTNTTSYNLGTTAAPLMAVVNLTAVSPEYDVILNGSFTHLDTDADTDGVQTTGVTVTGTGSTLDEVTATTVETSGSTGSTMTVAIDTSETGSEDVIPTQEYTVDVTVGYSVGGSDDNSMTLATGLSAGAWTLNGSQVTVPYMPFGPNTKVILRHTNTSAQSGDVSVRYMLEGSTDGWQDLGVVTTTSMGVQDIRDVVIDGIMADAGVESGKVAIEITSNVPETAVTIYAGYKVTTDADRGFVGTFGALGAAQD